MDTIRFTIGVDEYVNRKSGRKGFAVVVRKHTPSSPPEGEWLFGAGEDKAADLALLMEQIGPEKVKEAFRKGAIALSEIRQKAGLGARAGQTAKTIASLA